MGRYGTHQSCKNAGGFLNVPLYGWMLHLYNFVPNIQNAADEADLQGPPNPAADARFMRWNRNADFPICEFAPSGCGGGGGVAGVASDVQFDGSFCPINLAFLLVQEE